MKRELVYVSVLSLFVGVIGCQPMNQGPTAPISGSPGDIPPLKPTPGVDLTATVVAVETAVSAAGVTLASTSTPTPYSPSPTVPSCTPTFTASPASTSSPQATATFVDPTNTYTVTSSPTATATRSDPPTNTPVTSPTPSCAAYSDDFSSDTLGNYDYFDASDQDPGTAAGEGYSITGGQLEDYPPSGSTGGGMAVVKDALFSHSITDYTVEADFEINFSPNHPAGLFGLAFRTGNNGSFYGFQWDESDNSATRGGSPVWEVGKCPGSPSPTSTYLAYAFPNPAYVRASWVHLKVVVAGNRFLCYVNYNDGAGDRLIFDVTDNSAPYTSGGVGMRTYGIPIPYGALIRNFSLTACPKTPSS